MRESKFSFVRLDKPVIPEEDVMTVSLSKHGLLFLSRKFLNTYNANGKYMEFFGDSSKRALAWKIKDTLNDLKLLKPTKTMPLRAIRQNPKSGQAVMSIKKLLERMNIEPEDFKNLKVEEYKGDKVFGVGNLFYVKLPYNKEIKPSRSDEGEGENENEG